MDTEAHETGSEPRGVTRRGVIAVAAGGLIAGATVALSGWSPLRPDALTPGNATARTPLPIPPLAESEVAADGTRVFALTARTGESSFVKAGPTPTWGYDVPFLGPTLRTREGERVRVVVKNELPEPTTVHWHGMKVPARSDGGPHQPIEVGGEWTAEWTVEQPAATVWYHPHHHGTTEAHVYRGLGGLFYIDDDSSDANGLPGEYGVDDIPLVVTDRTFAPDGSFAERERTAFGMLGDTIIVNGAIDPVLEVQRPLTRLRLLNASTARSYSFLLQGQSMHLVGTDSGLVPEAVEVTSVTLTPGERAEVLVALEPGQVAMLQSVPHSLGLLKSTARMAGTEDRFDVLELRTPAQFDEGASDPSALGTLAAALPEPLGKPDAFRTMVMRNNKINGKSMSLTRIDEVVKAGDRERWTIKNQHHLPHNLHIHNARFMILEIDGLPPRPAEHGWKDTVYVPPGKAAIVDVEFGSSPDPDWPFMYHCHLLQHEDMGMMGQFVVIEQGQEPPAKLDTPATRELGDLGDFHVAH